MTPSAIFVLPPETAATAKVFINDNESGFLYDDEVRLEKPALHKPVSDYHHNGIGEDNADAT